MVRKQLVSEMKSTRKTIGEGNGNPLQYSCLENPMDGGAWWAAVHGVTESRTQLSNFTFTFHFHALENEMATHSSILGWRIPGTEEPGGLLSMWPQSWTWLKWLSSSSSSSRKTIPKQEWPSPSPPWASSLECNVTVGWGGATARII